jgi:CRISPR-associated endonuclease/helicase Cas3
MISHPEEANASEKTLKVHLTAVAKAAYRRIMTMRLDLTIISQAQLARLAWMIGIFHDFGKATTWFQKYIRKECNSSPKTRHSLVSAVVCYYFIQEERFEQLWAAIAYLIIKKHHGNLETIKDEEDRNLRTASLQLQNIIQYQSDGICSIYADDFNDIIERLSLIDIAGFQTELDDVEDIIDGFGKTPDEKVELFLIVNLLFSVLIDSDKKDAARLDDQYFAGNTDEPGNEIFSYLETRRNNDPKKFDPSKPLNKLRNNFLNEIGSNEQINAGQHFYTITAPTGIGKTFGCLAFANKLKACLSIGEGRIIYCLPYTSIIDQNYDEFEDIIKFNKKEKYRDKPSRYLLKHHHLEIKQIKNRISIEEYSYKDYLDDCLWVESWQSSFIVTTFVQLFHSIIGVRNRLLKKFHNIVNAIVILDEIQCINPEYYQLLRTILDVFGKRFNTYFLLITATQPEILDTVQSQPVELVSSAQYMNSNEFNRARLEIESEPISLDQFMVRFCDSFNGENALIVMNTKPCAIETYHAIKQLKNYNTFCLTTRLIPRDRKKKIKQIKSALKKNEKVIVASTQLIEAGVDFSFKYVYRDFAPLEAVVQTAGRCNRNGEYGLLGGKLILLKMENKRPYCLRIYNRKLIQFTQDILIENQYQGRDFYELTKKYYGQFDFTGKSNLIMKAILELNYDSDYYGQIPVKKFKLIEDYENEAVHILTTKDSQLKMDELVEFYKEIECKDMLVSQKNEAQFKIEQLRNDLKSYQISLKPYELADYEDTNIITEEGWLKYISYENQKKYAYDNEVGFLTKPKLQPSSTISI